IKFWQLGYIEPNKSGSIGVPIDTTGTIRIYGGTISPGITGNDGIARMSVPLYMSADYITKKFSANVSHPNYTATSVDMKLASITKVVLTGGNTLEVMPVDDATSEAILT